MDWFHSYWMPKTKEASRTIEANSLAQFMLAQRGLDEVSEDMYPFAMKDMSQAVERICLAIERQERILIHGDYDVDGMSATAVLYDFLSDYPVELFYHIPKRIEEGYGLKETGVLLAKVKNVSLLITVDCGIRSVDEVKALQDEGIDVIVTDHHELGEELPEALAVLNPHQADCPYPDKTLAGAGVALVLVEALAISLAKMVEEKYYAYACLGTIADVMPLTGKNRAIVKRGLIALEDGAIPSITAMLKDANHEKEIQAKDLSFLVIPKLNATGRMDDATLGFTFLLAKDESAIARSLKEILDCNLRRREEEVRVCQEVIARLQEQPEAFESPILLLKDDSWHPGVLGIAASRILRKYQKPVILFSSFAKEVAEDGSLLLRGSGRSDAQFDLHDTLLRMQEYFAAFGGHKSACGVSIALSAWDAFCEAVRTAAFLDDARESSSDGNALSDAKDGIENNRPSAKEKQKQSFLEDENSAEEEAFFADKSVYSFDAILQADAISLDLVNDLSVLEPYGHGNEEPLFLIPNLLLQEVRVIGKEKTHLRLLCQGGNASIAAICFGKADYAAWLKAGQRISLLAKLQENTWQGRKSSQLMVEDLFIPGEELFAIGDSNAIEDFLPSEKDFVDTKDFAWLWPSFHKLLGKDKKILSLKRLRRILLAVHEVYFSLDLLEKILQIFEEASLIRKEAILDEDLTIWSVTIPEKKVKLSETKTWKALVAEGRIVYE